MFPCCGKPDYKMVARLLKVEEKYALKVNLLHINCFFVDRGCDMHYGILIFSPKSKSKIIRKCKKMDMLVIPTCYILCVWV